MDMTFEYKWNQVNTKILIEYYAKYKSKVGTLDMKNNAASWKKITEDFLKINIKVSGNICQNRWKVLERNYKKFVYNQNKTGELYFCSLKLTFMSYIFNIVGRGRKHFEYENEVREIIGKIKNIHPEILLSTETEDHIHIPEEEINISSVGSEEIENDTERKNIETRKQRVVKNKNNNDIGKTEARQKSLLR